MVATLVLIALGAVAGFVVSLSAYAAMLKVVVTDTEVTLTADPHASAFSRWVEGAAGLPRGANALFKARQHALDENNAHHIAELRDELAKIGVVVRDEKERQYWRRSDRSVN